MERTILDIALFLIAFSVPLHIVLSAHWRCRVSEWVEQVQSDLNDIRVASNDLAYYADDADLPDMIGMLGVWREEQERADEIAAFKHIVARRGPDAYLDHHGC